MKTKKLVIISLIALAVFLLSGLSISRYLDWKNNYQNKVYPGIKIGSLDLSGKTRAETTSLLTDKTGQITDGGFVFQYGDKKITLDIANQSLSADLSSPLLTFDVDSMINKVFSFNEENTFAGYLAFTFKPAEQKNIKAIYTTDDQKIKVLLAESFKELTIPPENSYFSLDQGGELKTNPEKPGKEINYELALSELKTNLDGLNTGIIAIKTHSKYPEVTEADLGTMADQAKKFINQDGLYLSYASTTSSSTITSWHVEPERLLSWLSINKNQDSLKISLDKEKIKNYLSLTVAPDVNTEIIRPRFEVKNGKLNNWQTGTDGRELDLEASADQITNEFLNGSKTIPLIMKILANENINGNNAYNIQEIIGTGHSNFVGSPTNRIKNIKVGAAAVNGILLAPGEEFSLVKVLGDVSEQTGYFPELVIKDNKTIPEFGGGLCQVATTIFRSALASGLPITDRHNHSYRVSYYEPAGMDAAVYIPNPDVKFINDTGNYILIQSRIVKNDIYFDFWGKKDGRIATTTTPVVYNIVKPAPTKYTESFDLAPGVKKCTEHAHNGADAYFDYTVTYPEGATTTPVVERRFSSHYSPWREVCLIGASKASSTAMTATTTTEIKAGSTTTVNISTSTIIR
jgi:vancomycin resistance protein YoaR